MKIITDIPENELQEVIKYTGAKSKKEAVVYAVRDFNNRHRLNEIAKILGTFDGTFDDFMTQGDLKKMREDDKWEK